MQKQRRLPTKTRSGIITLPTASNPDAIITDPSGAEPASGLEDDDEELLLLQEHARALAKSRLEEAQAQQAHLESQASPPAQPTVQHDEGATSTSSSKHIQFATEHWPVHVKEEAAPCGRAPSQETPPVASTSSPSERTQSGNAAPKPGGSSRDKRGGPTITGPLNSSTAPAVLSLPVKRRGSYQNLKRQAGQKDGGDSGVLSMLKKATHWERFGTILVLYCAKDKSQEDALLQMMLVEGYDTEVVENQTDALNYFKSQEVFPDIVIIDTDHSYNTIQLIKQLHAQLSTVAVIVTGSPTSRPSAVSSLQAGAADYMRKPVDHDELIARIERHVQRQHCIKLELEKALEDVKNMMSQLATAGHIVTPAGNGKQGGKQGLGAVAETDFEEQMSELCEENQRLGQRLVHVEAALEQRDAEVRQLHQKLNALNISQHSSDTRPEVPGEQ